MSVATLRQMFCNRRTLSARSTALDRAAQRSCRRFARQHLSLWSTMRQETALLPQNQQSWSQELAEQSAMTSYGSSTAAAVVACVIYFVFLRGAAASAIYTRSLM